MKKRLNLIIFIAFLSLSYYSIQAFNQEDLSDEDKKIESTERESKAIPIMAFDLFQLILK